MIAIIRQDALAGFRDGLASPWPSYQLHGDAKYERLRALKRTYDPTNLFRLNQNIRP